MSVSSALASGLAHLAAVAPSPSPSPTNGPAAVDVTPGLAGFLATFAVAAAAVVLFLSLTRHLRRTAHNAREAGLPVDERRTIPPRRAGQGAPGTEGGPDRAPGSDAPGSATPGPDDATGPDDLAGGRG